MVGRKSLVGIALVCALAFGALAAGNASAAQWSYTCLKGGSGDFADPHCVTKGLEGPYGHKVVTETKLPVTMTNEQTVSKTSLAEVSRLKGALSGVATEIICTTLSGEGELGNSSSPENQASGTGVITYAGCFVAQPSGRGCVITGGKVTTKQLSATTEGQPANSLLVKPASGTEIASVEIEGCNIGALNNTFPIAGSLVASTSGATTTTTHASTTTQNTLKFGGVKAGLEGAVTTSGSEGAVALT